MSLLLRNKVLGNSTLLGLDNLGIRALHEYILVASNVLGAH